MQSKELKSINETLILMYKNINLMQSCFKDLIGMMYAKKIITGLESLEIDNYLDNYIPNESEINSTWDYNNRINWLKKQII
jgi:hypothetical protein